MRHQGLLFLLWAAASPSSVSSLGRRAGDELRRGAGTRGEFGATTGRPRRVGWFRHRGHQVRLHGAGRYPGGCLTCLDVLGYLDEIKVCTGYEIDGQVTDKFPVPAKLGRAKPVFTTLPGWKCDIRGITNYADLPENAKAYVDFLEQHIGCPIRIVSTGPKRHEICMR